MDKLLKDNRDLLVAILLSIATFYFQYGIEILNPTNIYWLRDDSYTQFIGWSFYRNNEFFTFPLFKIFDYGMNMGSTIIYTDSLPLMALLFKPFEAFLPINFQYQGVWIFACYVLTAYFGYKIFNLYLKGSYEKLICVLFLLCSPIILERFSIGHISLMGHWVILFSFYLYIKENTNLRSWMAIILISILIHGYIFAMVFVVGVFSLAKNYFKKIVTRKKTGIHFIAITSFSVVCLVVFGYFENINVFHGGWGGYRLNMLSIVNPNGLNFNWSQFISDSPIFNRLKIGDYEGFNYLGFGMIINLIFATYLAIKKKINIFSSVDSRLVIIFCLLLIIFGLTNHIAFGSYELLNYDLPGFLKVFTKPFRASGRFFWPVYYIIFISTLVFVLRNLNPKKALVYALLIFTIQVVDLSNGFQKIREFAQNTEEGSLYKKDLELNKLKSVAKDYKKLIYVFPSNAPKNWIQLSYFSYRNDLKTNFGYFARRNKKAEDRYVRQINMQFTENNLSKDSIYYFSDQRIWRKLYKKVRSKSKRIKIIDNYGEPHFVILPNK